MVKPSILPDAAPSSAPVGSEKNPIQLEPVVVYGRSRKQALLQLTDEYYYYNVEHWRQAMRYMRNIGDKDGEFAIYMKRLNYGRGQWAKGVFGLIGGIVGAVLTVEAFAVASAGISAGIASSTTTSARIANIGKNLFKTNFRSITTYYDMVIDGGTQALLSKDGLRDVNLVSLLAGGLSPALGALTNAIEIRPFNKDVDRQFRSVFHNKSVPETIFDASVHFGTGRASSGISNFVRNETKTQLEKSLLNHFAFPIFQTCNQFLLQGISPGIKRILGITEGGNDEKEQ